MGDLDGLEDLEQRLAGRGVPGLPPELRAQVLGKVRAACAKPRSSRIERLGRAGFGRFVAATAAVVILWLNLAMSAVDHTSWPDAAHGSAQELSSATRSQVRELLPDLDERTARVWAWRIRAGGGLVPAPQVPARGTGLSPESIGKAGTEVPWDTH